MAATATPAPAPPRTAMRACWSVAAAGSAAARFLGLPHEGEFALRRLIRLVGIDLGTAPLSQPGRPLPPVVDVLTAGQ